MTKCICAILACFLTLIVFGCSGGGSTPAVPVTQYEDPITKEAETAVKAAGKDQAPPGVKGSMTSAGFMPDEPEPDPDK